MTTTPDEPQVDLDHPWVEASLLGCPRPVEVQAKCEAYELVQGDRTVDVGLTTFITPVGVFNFYFAPNALGLFVMQGAEVMDLITATQRRTPLVLADKNMMRQEAERAQAAERLRGKTS